MQVLEQDRHALRRKLAATASEADSRLLELQADVRELQRAVEEREAALRSTEREKAALVAELTEQNARLAAQLKEVGIDERLPLSQEYTFTLFYSNF